MNLPHRLAAPLLLVACALPASGHDFWVLPSAFRVRPGTEVGLSLRVGERFVGDAVPLNPPKVERFACFGPEGEVPLAFAPGVDPAATFTPTSIGLHVVGYRSRRSRITLDAGKFEAYLAAEGLERVSAWRAAHGEADAPGREVYSRCAKSLILVGDAPSPRGGADRALGLPLEIVPVDDPTALAPGAGLRLRVVHDGHALAGALVRATREGAADGRRGARTDAEGRAELVLDAAGTWLVTCVHMVRAPAEAQADWESLWASLTFDLVSPPAEAPPAPRAPTVR